MRPSTRHIENTTERSLVSSRTPAILPALVTHRHAFQSLPAAPCWHSQLARWNFYSSFFQGPLCSASPSILGAPKMGSTGCSAGDQRLLLSLLASTPNCSLHTPYEGVVQVSEHICVMHCAASCTQIQLKGEETRLRLVQGVDFPSCPCSCTIWWKGAHDKLDWTLFIYARIRVIGGAFCLLGLPKNFAR